MNASSHDILSPLNFTDAYPLQIFNKCHTTSQTDLELSIPLLVVREQH